ncbi:transcription factor bHLH81-like [Impatiens glandulifera]|uniref:transcription factor bHLH81-like n=1 Tax=Impatiens glandulifera TaxID=253017 RepID=UPI001FB0C7D4|nr:transcription factor bHLH81-like [Impatiens glandulifera]
MDQQQQQQQINPGLTRYRSAPSSYFTSLLNSSGGGGGEEKFDQFLKPHPYNSSRFAPGVTRDDSSLHNTPEFDESEGLRSQSSASIDHQSEDFQNRQPQQDNNNTAAAYSFSEQVMNQKPSMDNSFRAANSIRGGGLSSAGAGAGGGGGINLIRQSSSPAGFLSSYFNAAENDFSEMGGMGNSGLHEGNTSESTFSSSRLRVQMDFSSRRMAPIPETTNSMGIGSPEGEIFGEAAERSGGGYIPSFPIESWDDSMNLSRSFLELEDDDIKPEADLNAIENQNVEDDKPTSNTLLSRHLSLPQSTMEKLLQFQDSVPFKTRAKRGCATHPRSVAERVRRTKISERIRKLQELVPNMDKQTNTADMLDLAVDYIKELQRQAKILTESQANCTCPHKNNR